MAVVPVRRRRTAAGCRPSSKAPRPHHVLAAAIRTAGILGMLPLLGVDRFDRRRLNRALAAHAPAETRAA